MYRAISYRTVPCHTEPHRTLPYHIARNRIVPCRTILDRTIPYHTVSYRIPYRAPPYRTVPYHSSPCRTVLYFTASCGSVRYRTVTYRLAERAGAIPTRAKDRNTRERVTAPTLSKNNRGRNQTPRSSPSPLYRPPVTRPHFLFELCSPLVDLSVSQFVRLSASKSVCQQVSQSVRQSGSVGRSVSRPSFVDDHIVRMWYSQQSHLR